MTKEPLDGDAIFILREFSTPLECNALIEHSESHGYEEATITTAAGAVMNKGVRNNRRFMEDAPALAAHLWLRAKSLLPGRVGKGQAIGFNERLRYYRYDVGQQFEPHSDGAFRRANGEQSQLTFMVFLNDDFSGGETVFYTDAGTVRFAVRPEQGAALVFLHGQAHEGAPVVVGRKYVLRTDVMYA